MPFPLYFFLLFILATTSTSYLLPHPPGPYNISLTHTPLTTHTHSLMLSIFRSATCASTIAVPYMPSLTANYQALFAKRIFNVSLDISPILLSACLPLCPGNSSEAIDAPVLLFSPGYRGTRFFYSVLASAIASEGVVVVTMDHPGDTNIIEYPNGTVVYSNASNADYEELAVYAEQRVQDISGVIDSTILPRGNQINVAGHSLGGAASLLASSRNPRVAAAINLDGPFLGVLPASDITKRVLTIASEHEDYPSLVALWEKLAAEKLWVKARGMTHEGMLDLPVLLDAVGQKGALGDALGTIESQEGVRILAKYVVGWMRGEWDAVLGGEEGVEVVRRGGF